MSIKVFFQLIMQRIKTIIDRKANQELLSATFCLGWLGFAISLLCVVLYFLFGIIFNDWLSPSLISCLAISVLILILSLIILFYLSNNLKQSSRYVREAIYDFLDDALLYEVYQNDEKIEEGKVRYCDLLDYKETKNYIYLRLRNNTFICVSKVDGLLDFIISKGIHKNKIIVLDRKK